jgi:hypothetical protein
MESDVNVSGAGFSEEQAKPRLILQTIRPCDKLKLAFPFKFYGESGDSASFILAISASWLSLWESTSDGVQMVQRQNIQSDVVAACTVPLSQTIAFLSEKPREERPLNTMADCAVDALLCLDAELCLHLFAYRLVRATEATAAAAATVGLFCRVASHGLRSECGELAQIVERGLAAAFRLRYIAELDRLLLNAGQHVVFCFEGIREWINGSHRGVTQTSGLTSVLDPVPRPQQTQRGWQNLLQWQVYPALGFVQDAVSLTVPFRARLSPTAGSAMITVCVSSVVRELRSVAWREPNEHLPSSLLSVFVDDLWNESQANQATLLANFAAEVHNAMADMPEAPLRYDARTQCWRIALPPSYVLGLVADTRAHTVLVIANQYVMRVRFDERSLRPLLDSPVSIPETVSAEENTSNREIVAYDTLPKPGKNPAPLLVLTLMNGQIMQCDGSSLWPITLASMVPVCFSTDARNDVGLVAIGGSAQVSMFRWDVCGSTEWICLERPWLHGLLRPAYADIHTGDVAFGLIYSACRNSNGARLPYDCAVSGSTAKAPETEQALSSRHACFDPRDSSVWILHERTDGIHGSRIVFSDYAIVQSESEAGFLTGSSRMFWLKRGQILMICDRAFSQSDGLSSPLLLHIDEASGLIQDISDTWPLSEEVLSCFYESVVVTNWRLFNIRVSPRAQHNGRQIEVQVETQWTAPARITLADATMEDSTPLYIAVICRSGNPPLQQLILVERDTLSERCRHQLQRFEDVTAFCLVTTNQQLRAVALSWSDGALSILDWDRTHACFTERQELYPFQATSEGGAVAVESISSVLDGNALLVSLRNGWLLQLDLASGKLCGGWHLSHQPLKLYRLNIWASRLADEILVAGHALWRASYDPRTAFGCHTMLLQPLAFAHWRCCGVPTTILSLGSPRSPSMSDGDRSTEIWKGLHTWKSYVVSNDGRLQVVAWHLHRAVDEDSQVADIPWPYLRAYAEREISEKSSAHLSFWWKCCQTLVDRNERHPEKHEEKSETGSVDLISEKLVGAAERGCHTSHGMLALSRFCEDSERCNARTATLPRNVLAVASTPVCPTCPENERPDLVCLLENGVLAVSLPIALRDMPPQGELHWLWELPLSDRDWPCRSADLAVQLLDHREARRESAEETGLSSVLRIVVALAQSTLQEVILCRYHVSSGGSPSHCYDLMCQREIRTGMEQVSRLKFLSKSLLLVADSERVGFFRERTAFAQPGRPVAAHATGSLSSFYATSNRSDSYAQGTSTGPITDSNPPRFWRPEGLYIRVCGTVASIQVDGTFESEDGTVTLGARNIEPSSAPASAFLATSCGALYQLTEWPWLSLRSSTEIKQADCIWSGLVSLQHRLWKVLPFFMGLRIGRPARSPSVSADGCARITPDERILDWDILRYWRALLPGPFSFDAPDARLVRELLRIELYISS